MNYWQVIKTSLLEQQFVDVPLFDSPKMLG